MSKLTDIIDAATGETVSIGSLLRMVKVLAARVETQVLLDWVDNELGGYRDAHIPEYRGPFQVQVLSDWSGPMDSILRNVPLPPSAFPQWLRDIGTFEVVFKQSVSELERLAQADGALSFGWGTDLIGRINGQMRGGHMPDLQRMAPMHGIVTANRMVSPGLIESVLDQVRTRVLGLALDLERVMPDAGEPGAQLSQPETVTNIVNTFIYGSGNTLALGSPGAVQVETVVAGDLAGLLNAVSALGLSPDRVSELRMAIEADEADAEKPKAGMGTRVAQFLAKAAIGGMTIAGKTGTEEGIKMLDKAVGNYLGIAPT